MKSILQTRQDYDKESSCEKKSYRKQYSKVKSEAQADVETILTDMLSPQGRTDYTLFLPR